MIRRLTTSVALLCLILTHGCKEEKAPAPAVKKAAIKKTAPRPASKPSAPSPAAPGKPTLAKGTTDAAAQGKSHYLRACAPCHGLDGSGAQMRQMFPKIGDLTSASTHARLRDPEIIRLIKKGRGKMPPMGNSLSEEHIVQIVAYIRTLNKG